VNRFFPLNMGCCLRRSRAKIDCSGSKKPKQHAADDKRQHGKSNAPVKELFHGSLLSVADNKKARTQRALVCGTAKRLGEKHAKPRPGGRVQSAVLSFKFAVFRRDRSRSYAKLLAGFTYWF